MIVLLPSATQATNQPTYLRASKASPAYSVTLCYQVPTHPPTYLLHAAKISPDCPVTQCATQSTNQPTYKYILTYSPASYVLLIFMKASATKAAYLPIVIDVPTFVSPLYLLMHLPKGRMSTPKRMKLRKSSKRPLNPPPHFRKIILRISRQKCVCSLWRDCCVLYDPISHEMHVVQQFNVVIG